MSSQALRERALRALEELPPMSPILHRVITTLAREDISFAKIAELIERDTVLAGNILRLVNSALFGRPHTVSSVRHAVSLLGVTQLRYATLSMAAAQMWHSTKTPPGWSMESFSLQSVSVAILADLLARHLAVTNAAGAFAAGLFHDLGILLIAIGLPEEYQQISLLYAKDPAQAVEHELRILGASHADLSADALAIWNLPEPIRVAVRYHIWPELDPSVSWSNGITLSRILHSADAYVLARRSVLEVPEEYASRSEAALESLGLGECLPVLLGEFDNELAAIQPYF